jgi:exosortase J
MAAIIQVPAHTSRSIAEGHRTLLVRLLPWLLIGFAGLMLLAAAMLWQIWTTDALRSIGIYFPVVSLVLTLRVWRRFHWETRGTWWGVLPLFYAIVMGRAGGNAVQAFAFTLHTDVSLLPKGLTIYAFGSGVVLLLGGVRIWRKAAFPLALLLFVNPVPTAFAKVDLPLQYFCAHAARAFALAMGVHPDGSQLRLMFAPGFGMFIAPGCDGVRGAVTMGYLALILGYVYRFSLRTRVLSVLGAVALGYVFNLIRLCVLVLFYWVALRFPFLQPHGEGMDYLIGGSLFLGAAILFAAVVRRNKQGATEGEMDEPLAPPLASRANLSGEGLHWKGIAVSILVVLGSFPFLSQVLGAAPEESRLDSSRSLVANILPEQVGKYKLLRTWTEQDQNHPYYRWEAYSAGASLAEIDVAYWLGAGMHYPIQCHIARGDKPVWQKVETLSTANGGSATFDLNFYAQNGGGILEATTLCDRRGCNEEEVVLPSLAGVVLVGLGTTNSLFRLTSRPLPVLIRQQSNNPEFPSDSARIEMLHKLRDFISGINIGELAGFAESKNQ